MFPFSKVAVAFFGLIALLHLLRLIFKVDMVIGSFQVPQWVSVGGFIIFLVLCVGLWREVKAWK